MNYLKKKIKGSKKSAITDDDDLDPNLFHVPHSREGAPSGWVPYDERIDEESEEWRAFRLLSQRVTDTLQETKENLSKIVATTALSENSRDIKQVTVGEETVGDSFQPNGLPSSERRQEKPERPPPPSSSSRPPRPPPPNSERDPFEAAFAGSTALDFGSGFEFEKTAVPPRPPPPSTTALDFDLSHEFGFGQIQSSAARSVSKAPGSLFLDDDVLGCVIATDDGDDPFDTSFVDDPTRQAAPESPCSSNPEQIVAASITCGSVKGVISEDELDAFGDISEDDDDPFIVKETVLSTEAMDPFESFLQGTSGNGEVRAKSPNPFLMETQDVTYMASSNPFTGASSNDAADDPFGVQLAPNPFAEMTKTSSTDAATSDLFGFESTDFSTSGMPKMTGNVFDLLGEEAEDVVSEDFPPPPPSVNGVVLNNPFASFAQGKEATPSSHFDPFDTIECSTEIFQVSNQSIVSSQKSVFEEPEASGTIPAAPSSENLFSLDFKPDLFSVDSTTDTSSNITELNFTTFVSDVPTKESPQIDFFKTDSEVINVSGVSVELSEMSPAKLDDDFDEFFVSKEAHGTTSPTQAPSSAPAPATSGPPPRPPPPTTTTKPARPPPPNIATKQHPEKEVWDAFSMDVATSKDSNSVTAEPSAVSPFESKVKPDVVKTSMRCESGEDTFDAFGITPERTASATMDGFFATGSATMPAKLVDEVDVAQPAPMCGVDDVLDFFGDVSDAPLPPPPPLPPVFASSNKSSLGEVDLLAGDAFATTATDSTLDIDLLETIPMEPTHLLNAKVETVQDSALPFTDMSTFDAFEAKFESTASESVMSDAFDPFGGGPVAGFDVTVTTETGMSQGFGAPDDFDPFFALKDPPAAPKPSPARFPIKSGEQAEDSDSDSDDTGPDFTVFIRPKMKDKDDASSLHLGPIPALAPPPKSPMRSPPSHTSPRFNPFDKEHVASVEETRQFVDVDAFSAAFSEPEVPRTLPGVLSSSVTAEAGKDATPKMGTTETQGESMESPGSPLFEADDTEPLEDFYPALGVEGWDLMLRQPSKKKLTGQRFWKKVFVTLSDNGVLHLHNKQEDKDAFQELPLQACYSMTEIGAQQYDNYGKIFTVKLQYVFYRERVGVRPGQISKVTHGQVTSLGQLAKLGRPLEHSPQVSQLLKLGTQTYEDLRIFIRVVEDGLFRLTVHRDRALTYKTEEVQVTVVDELRAEVQASGMVLKQLARVRVFLLAFIVGMPDVELGLNDITKQGKEVVGRHDIIPVITEEWIRLEKCEFHSCVMVSEFEKSRTIKFHPPDACFFEIMRFRIRPPRNRELPLQVKATMSVIGNRVEIRADVLVPGCISRKHGQIPCEDVAIRFPLPECWIYLFRVEKHFRYGSIKSAARKPGKIKGLERIMGAGLTMEPSMIEVSTGQAKYEHQHRAIVWRVPRLPKDGQGAYTTQLFVCRLELTSYDQIPAEFDRFIYVEFTMPATTVSHTTVRSVSVTNPNPPEKYVKYLARHKYRVEVEHVTATSECDYVAATSGGGSISGNGSDAPSH